MAYVSVLDWRPEQVTEWLKGLESCLSPYLHWFSNNQINGHKLLCLCPDDLNHLGVVKIGHQELVLEAVQQLRNFHYELDRENLQALALRVACASHSLYNQVRDADESCVTTQIMADVSNVIQQVKALVSWLDRAPFSGNLEYAELKPQLLSASLKMALSAQRGRFAENPITAIKDCSSRLAKLADSVIQDSTDPMILQPAYLDLATLKKRAGEDLGFFLVPSFHGEHQVGDMKLSSPAHQSGKIQPGDEVVQVNYQTVVGWSRKKVIALIEESPNDLLLTLKRRPQHVKMYGQIYMKPYRLPSRKRAAPYSRWNENLPSPRPEFLTIPRFELPSRVVVEKKPAGLEDSMTCSSSSDEEFPPAHSTSPTSMRLYLPKPRAPLQRRFTLSGPPRPSAQSEQFWRDLQLERSWRSSQNNSQLDGERNIHSGILREKSASVSIAATGSKASEVSHAISDAKSIIELNKVKRNAFFSNMGGVPKPTAPRGRLDKSRSTPAYDLGEPEPKDPPSGKQNRIDLQLTEDAIKCEEKRAGTPPTDAQVVEPSLNTSDLAIEHGQMVNTINQTLRTEPDDDPFFRDIPPAPREIRPIPAQRRIIPAQVPPIPLPPKPKTRPLPPVPPPRQYLTPQVIPTRGDVLSSPSPSRRAESSSSVAHSPTSTEKDRMKNPLEQLKAMLTLGRNNSPRTIRKQNPALSKRRQISVKDVSPGEVSGMLWHRRRRGPAIWRQEYFVLHGGAFYGFRHRDQPTAHLFIFLPGFTCSVAHEVKSRNHAFKIYHTGTVFYFAAETEEELQQWLDGACLAATSQEESKIGENLGWSETDSESSDNDNSAESCFPTAPRVNRLIATPARSQQNLSSENTKSETPRKFHSLKKLGSSKGAPTSTDGNEAASLDRKYLRFLTQKNTPVPVPTSQFRSYRRMQQPAPPPRPPPAPEQPKLIRRALHSSNPSLANSDMADYRMTQERLREFRSIRNQERAVDLSGFITLEQFMLSRQEEERNMRSARQIRSRVYPVDHREPVSERRERTTEEKPQVAIRSQKSTAKYKASASPSSTSALSDDAACIGPSSSALPDYPGIEYPPAFEPETYILQYMINSRRRKDAK